MSCNQADTYFGGSFPVISPIRICSAFVPEEANYLGNPDDCNRVQLRKAVTALTVTFHNIVCTLITEQLLLCVESKWNYILGWFLGLLSILWGKTAESKI